MNRHAQTVLPSLLALVLAAAAAPGAGAAGLEVVEVRIYAVDLESHDNLASVGPGGVLTLPPEVEVRLRMAAVPRGRGERFPGATFEVGEGEVVRSKTTDQGGSVVLKARPPRPGREVAGIEQRNPEAGGAVLKTWDREGESTVRYAILADDELSIPERLRTGAFTLRVERGVQLGPVPEPDAAHELVAALYRGILDREAEQEGREAAVERIEGRGYPEAIAVAMEIARSDESRVAVYQRGTTYEQRLGALYRHLLGLDPGEVDAATWRADLERLRAGRIDDVVGAMVRSETFRVRFGYQPEPRRRYAVPRP